MNASNFHPLAKVCAILSTFSLLMLTLYLAWAAYRVSGTVLAWDGVWPRPWPYPDEWLGRWHERLIAARTSPVKGIDMHGELPRLRLYLWAALAASAGGLVLGCRWVWHVCRGEGQEGM